MIDNITMGDGEVPDPKPGHVGISGPPIGPLVYLIVRHDGKMVDVEPTRHDAVGRALDFHDCDDYSIEPVPVGALPVADLIPND